MALATPHLCPAPLLGWGNLLCPFVRHPLAPWSSEGLYHCDYCHKDLSSTLRIKCAVCKDFDLCLECFRWARGIVSFYFTGCIPPARLPAAPLNDLRRAHPCCMHVHGK